MYSVSVLGCFGFGHMKLFPSHLIHFLVCFHRNKTTSVEEDRPSTNSHTDNNMESLVLDHDKPGSGDDIPTASTSSSVKSSKVVDIEQEKLMEDWDRDESASVSVESGGCQTIVPLSSEREQTHNSSDKVNQSPLVQGRAIQDQVDTEIELERIGDSDEDTLLGGDNIQTSTHASRIRSRLMKMLKEVRSGFIKSLIDLKFFMR